MPDERYTNIPLVQKIGPVRVSVFFKYTHF
jgi:hypothetical protein